LFREEIPEISILPDNTVKMASKELTYQDVAEHNTKKDLYVVIHDKVYDVSKFVDEHP
jgi:cytochrome b involved in lipid metabolism